MRTQLDGVEYLGGWPNYSTPSRLISVAFDEKGVAFGGTEAYVSIPWEEMTAIIIEGPDVAHRQPSVARVLALGIFALATPKNMSQAYLQFDAGDRTASFMVQRTSAGELRALLGRWTTRVSREAAPMSIADELQKLANLRDAGVLDDTEFQAQKMRLLDN